MVPAVTTTALILSAFCLASAEGGPSILTTHLAIPICPRLECLNLQCIDRRSPVCGSDGRVYINICFLKLANCLLCGRGLVRRVKDSICQPGVATTSTTTAEPETTTPLNCDKIPCTLIYKPVCGSNGETYSNECVLGAENCKRGPDDQITIEQEGVCPTIEPTTAEPETTTPLNCDKIPCTLIYKPVCGSNGETYSNECVLGAENCKRGPDDQITIEQEGVCPTIEPTTAEPETTTPLNCDKIPCTLIYKPVCGSNGETYSNECVLGAENCKRGPDDQITIEQEGVCPTIEPTTAEPETTTPRNCDKIPCTLIYKPVCGSNGETYSNECVLGAENCKRGPDDQITIEQEGVCPTIEPTTAEPETTTPRNCDKIPCTLIYKPVCGSNGETYSNECVLGAENCKRGPDDQITIEQEGICPTIEPTTAEPETTTPRNCDNIPCTFIYKPVCGSDGETYSNECVLGVENCKRGSDDQITIEQEGVCPTIEPTTAEPETTTSRNCDNIPCTLIYKPVCGSDSETYSNECVLGAENCKRGPDDQITIEQEGVCPTIEPTTAEPETTTPRNCDNIPCTLIYKPVCGSDGETYSNECVLGAENCKRGPDDQITIEQEGVCPTIEPTTAEPETTTPRNCDNIPCTLIYKPVCGSDGETYSNECVLGAENCKRGPDDQITIEQEGVCPTIEPTTAEPETTTPRNCDNIPCTLIYKPVCGSDGETYSNECVLGAENCKRGPDDQITIEQEGVCPTIEPTTAEPETTTPRNCYNQPEATTTMESAATRTARNVNNTCPKVLDLVCGSNGQTYLNPCHLRLENSKRYPAHQITVEHGGVCAMFKYIKCHLIC